MNEKHNTSSKISTVLIYVALIVFAAAIIIPVGWVFMASMKTNPEFYGRSPWSLPEGFNYANFVGAFKEAKMGTYMLNSVIVTALSLIFLLVIAIPAAYVLARYRFRGSKLLNIIFMAGLFINVNYIVVPIFLMLVNGNTILARYSLPPFLLNNLVILALIYASTHLPFTIYLLSSFFSTIPTDYEEAAFVDGGGYFYTMFKVMIPMARPAVITIILFNFLAFWNEYIISMTLMTKDQYKTLPVGLMNLVSIQKAATNYGQLYAGLVIVMLPTLILYMLVQKRLTQGMSLGGLKG